MKLRYYFIALLGLLFFATSCEEDASLTLLDEVQVSSSYVAIPVAGGSTSITVTATDAWEIDAATIPAWVTIAPTTGAAGETTVTFTAESTLDGRNGTVNLNCAGATQKINVIQGLSTITKATCAEVIAGPEKKNYLVTGVCTAIANTNYGNWYLNDGTGEIYIYGTVNASGSYAWSSFNIEVGDEVTVQGPKTVYNGTVELVDAAFVSVSKSLIKVDSLSTSNLTSDGGDYIAYLTCKGDGVNVSVPEDAQEWLSIKSINGTTIVFHATANTAGPRSTTLVFTTTKSGKNYTAETTISQDGLSGTIDVPFTVSEAIAYCNKLGGTSTSEFYIKGKVSKVLYTFSANYGTGTFWISDDGAFNGAENGKSTDDKEHDFECYSVYWLGNQPWADGNAQVSVGDEVMICGKVTLYNGVAETSSKAAYVYSINGATTDVNGVGSLDYPFNVKGAIDVANAIGGTSDYSVFVKGIASRVLYSFSSSYGTGTFWLSDDGAFNGAENGKGSDDKAHDFECYSVYWFDNQPWADGDGQVEVGDIVVVNGQITLYNGLAETASKKAYVYSLFRPSTGAIYGASLDGFYFDPE